MISPLISQYYIVDDGGKQSHNFKFQKRIHFLKR